MKSFVIAVMALGLTTSAAEAGCLKGAVVGGVVGHFAGHHALAGAAVGCVVAHHHAVVVKRQRQAYQPR
jgi:hypothetical protein